MSGEPKAAAEAELRAQIAHLDQYLGLWAMHAPKFHAALARINGLNLIEHVAQTRVDDGAAEEPQKPYLVSEGGIAQLAMIGPMTKYGSSLSPYRGSLRLRRDLRAAVADEDVRGILLHIDSPGGTVAGTEDLADEVARAASIKPVTAYVEDLAASGAYYVASQAGRISASPSAEIGSIGVYMVVDDYSGAFAQKGIKAHVIRAGEFKGAGVEGSEITAAQLSVWQREIADVYELFVESVARGRGLETENVRGLANGEVWLAGKAKRLKLIDRVQREEQALADLERGAVKVRESRATAGQEHRRDEAFEEPDMANEEKKKGAETPAPSEAAVATVAELRAAFPAADEKFLLGCIEAGASLAHSKDRWTAHLEAALKERDQRIAEQQAEIHKAQEATYDLRAAQQGGSPGGQAVDKAPDAGATLLSDEERWERDWSQNVNSVQAEFDGNKATYLAALKAFRDGRARVFTRSHN